MQANSFITRFTLYLTKTAALMTRASSINRCWLCGERFADKQHSYFCKACSDDLPHNTVRCICCALPMTQTSSSSHSPAESKDKNLELTCGECISQTPHFLYSISSYRYEFPVQQLIKSIKYQKQRYWIKPLTRQLITDIQNASVYTSKTLPELLIPVPLHPEKRKLRTFNQAALIARDIERCLKIPLRQDILLKTSATDNQATLNKTERMLNLKDSFSLSRKEKKRLSIVGKHIALIDDVMTTKATAELASKRLLDAGASRVDVWCLARTPKYRDDR